MDPAIVRSRIRLFQAKKLEDEFQVLGTSILAHISALPGLLKASEKEKLPGNTISWYGPLYLRQSRTLGYQHQWVGKAFEYAVTELFNNTAEPFYSIIYNAIDLALSTRMSSRIKVVDINIDNLSCVRVCKESSDSTNLIQEFGRCRILADARRTVGSASRSSKVLNGRWTLSSAKRS